MVALLGVSRGLTLLFSSSRSFTTSSLDDSNLFSYTTGGFAFGNYRDSLDGLDLYINSSQVYQEIDGYGAAMTDSSAYLLGNMKSKDSGVYNDLMDYLFDRKTGLQILRVTLGSSDFSLQTYDFAPNQDYDTAATMAQRGDVDSLLKNFSIDEAKKQLIPVLLDAKQRNPQLKIMLSPWSPPKWTKSSNQYGGGSLRGGFEDTLAEYYARTLKSFSDAGLKPWAITLQNEPTHNAAYPSMLMSPSTQVTVAQSLKSKLATYGGADIKIIAHDNNFDVWSDAANVVNNAGNSVDGVGFHCYNGQASQVSSYIASVSSNGNGNKDIHMTECSGVDTNESRWGSMNWWLNNIFYPMAKLNGRSAIAWNLALDPGYGPRLSSAYCSNCKGVVTLSSPQNFMDPWLKLESQILLMNHFSTASTDLSFLGGGKARRIGMQVNYKFSDSGNSNACLNAAAFAAPLQGSVLSPPSKDNQAPATKRVGLVLTNSCSSTQVIAMALDGRASYYGVEPGVSSLVWTAP
ncbi:glycoside hydrolase [Violaceomyces palustris]|uniref:Glycoside hydrolase n=1 Tax=Violaceomyces palustris TaxID=1673888 RepID=A0ACD0NPM0_9BASI|nr:glycoside hydrolase [Violaceomyces palustris]